MFPERYDMYVDGEARCRLDDVRYLTFLVQQVAEVSGMELRSINVERIDPKDDFEDGGISVQGLITTSHIAIHTWPRKRFFMFDLVSCKEFRPQSVFAVLEDVLGIFTVHRQWDFTQLESRGVEDA